jgi:hypothetical protein
MYICQTESLTGSNAHARINRPSFYRLVGPRSRPVVAARHPRQLKKLLVLLRLWFESVV